MNKIATVKMQENGEIKIPRNIREDLQLKKGTRLLVLEEEDSLLLKRLEALSWEDRFEKAVKEIREEIKKKGLTKKDLLKAIQEVRAEKR